MNSYTKLFLILLIGSISACNSASEKPKGSDAVEEEEVSGCIFQPTNQTRKTTFPFNIADKIEVVSFEDKSQYFTGSTINDSVFKVDGQQESVALNEQQIDSLFSILYNFGDGDGMYSTKECVYSANHSIVFYKGKKAFAFLEISFACADFLSRGPWEHILYCDEHFDYLRNYLKWIGIKKGV